MHFFFIFCYIACIRMKTTFLSLYIPSWIWVNANKVSFPWLQLKWSSLVVIVLNLFDTAQCWTNKTLQSSWRKVGTRFVFGVWLESTIHIWFLYIRFVSAFSVRFYLVRSSVCINQVNDLTKPEQKKRKLFHPKTYRRFTGKTHYVSRKTKAKNQGIYFSQCL